jgi:hypothetical protein
MEGRNPFADTVRIIPTIHCLTKEHTITFPKYPPVDLVDALGFCWHLICPYIPRLLFR